MNDPWDVKSVRQSDQYISCMKINGVPLLPPVLSKECRQEMEYYKLLAKEVEKRISILKPYVEADSDCSEDKTYAPELPECESYVLPPEQKDSNVTIENITAFPSEATLEDTLTDTSHSTITENYNSITSNVLANTTEANVDTTKLLIGINLSGNETDRSIIEKVKSAQRTPSLDLPERDCDIPKKLQKEVLTDFETVTKDETKYEIEIPRFNFDDRSALSDPFSDIPYHDGPPSLSAKSFTGSLHDIHTESLKESQAIPKLIRQRSYTVLQPSPQLLAHLEYQSMNTGVDVTAISMSESLSNLSPGKKRRSWDLETAKEKWSSMALELKKNVPSGVKTMNGAKNHAGRPVTKKASQISPYARTRSVTQDKNKRPNGNSKNLPKSDPIQKPKNISSPVRIPSNKTIVKETISPVNRTFVKDPTSPTYKTTREQLPPKADNQIVVTNSPKRTPPIVSGIVSGSEDPATKVRELYEKIQKQQLIQMASLVEKQKREQMLLQQVFEEQNNILFKQLKTICPKSPVEVKMAWGDKPEDGDRGPVSLSQLINVKSPEQSIPNSPVANTLTETKNYINKCDNVLKKSRDITSSIRKQQPKANGATMQGSKSQCDGNKPRSHSPPHRNTSRKLNYDTTSSEREYEGMLTDRTNDTFADLNVTFPSDTSNDSHYNTPRLSNASYKDVSVKNCTPVSSKTPSQCRSTDSAIRTLEDSIQHSMSNMCSRPSKQSIVRLPPTAQERAAATVIVAAAKGWLVRRLLRTERVQATVQTIRDALLCALQLHQDREGIRGADVDLHRRLIQQITAACYSLHDTFVASSPADRCAVIAADRDRDRRRSLAARHSTPRSSFRATDV